jgi:hypothetical protein
MGTATYHSSSTGPPGGAPGAGTEGGMSWDSLEAMLGCRVAAGMRDVLRENNGCCLLLWMWM